MNAVSESCEGKLTRMPVCRVAVRYCELQARPKHVRGSHARNGKRHAGLLIFFHASSDVVLSERG